MNGSQQMALMTAVGSGLLLALLWLVPDADCEELGCVLPWAFRVFMSGLAAAGLWAAAALWAWSLRQSTR